MPSHRLAVLLAALLSTSTAFAQSWRPEPSGTTAELRGLSVVSDKVAWASGAKGTVLRTVDGVHWQALQVAQARYDRGISTYLDVTDAQRSTLSADRAAAQIRTQRLIAAVAVARALGGGWSQGAPEGTIAQAGK